MMSKKHEPEPQSQPEPQTQSFPSNPTSYGNTTEERAAAMVNPGEPGSAEQELTHAQEVFGSSAVTSQSVDPTRPLYGEEPGEGGMGRAVTPMQGQEYYNQDEKNADPRTNAAAPREPLAGQGVDDGTRAADGEYPGAPATEPNRQE